MLQGTMHPSHATSPYHAKAEGMLSSLHDPNQQACRSFQETGMLRQKAAYRSIDNTEINNMASEA